MRMFILCVEAKIKYRVPRTVAIKAKRSFFVFWEKMKKKASAMEVFLTNLSNPWE